MKAVLVSGVPGSGKTYLTRALMKGKEMPFFKEGLVIGHKSDQFTVFGDYRDDTEVFAGTDKMSMAVSPEFQEYIKKNTPNFFLEGDRLVGNKTIDFLVNFGYDLKVIVLSATKEEIKERYDKRGSNQDEKFLRSKETKVSNIESRIDLVMSDSIHRRMNQTPEDCQKNVFEISNFLNLI